MKTNLAYLSRYAQSLIASIAWVILFTCGVCAQSDAALQEAARLISARQISRPALADIPTGSRQALERYLADLDEYARYFSPKEFQAFKASFEGRFVGVGVATYIENGRLLMIPIPGGPLARAGVAGPVYLLGIGKNEVNASSLELARDWLSGEAGSYVVLEIEDAVSGEVRRLGLLREPFHGTQAELDTVAGLPVIRIYDFIPYRTRSEVSQLTINAKRFARQRGITDYCPILDMRYASGGDLYEAIDLTSQFLVEGTPIATVVDVDGISNTFRAKKEAKLIDDTRCLILLTSSHTASAAEVMVSALKFANAAVAGAPTFGKCVGQDVFSLAGGAGLIITTKRILGPERKFCEGLGIAPDRALSAKTNLHDTAVVLAGFAEVSEKKFDFLRAALGERAKKAVTPPKKKAAEPKKEDEKPADKDPLKETGDESGEACKVDKESGKDDILAFICLSKSIEDRADRAHRAFELDAAYGPFPYKFRTLNGNRLCLGPVPPGKSVEEEAEKWTVRTETLFVPVVIKRSELEESEVVCEDGS